MNVTYSNFKNKEKNLPSHDIYRCLLNRIPKALGIAVEYPLIHCRDLSLELIKC